MDAMITGLERSLIGFTSVYRYELYMNTDIHLACGTTTQITRTSTAITGMARISLGLVGIGRDLRPPKEEVRLIRQTSALMKVQESFDL